MLSARPVTATIGTARSRKERQDANDFFGLPAEREHQNDVFGVQAAQVAVNRLARMQKVAARPRRGECRGNFLADQARLAHAADDHAAARRMKQPHRMAKLFAQPVRQGEQRLPLAANHLPGQTKLLKRAERIGGMPRSGCHERHP